MLPSRGLTRNPASALRYSLSSRTKPSRTLSTRQFSQAQSQSSVLSRRSSSRANISQHGQIAPSISAVGCGTSVGIASSVFAQRSGATRNLSLWPFQSKPQTPQTPQATDTPAEWSAPAEAQPPAYETSSLSTPAEPASSAAVPPASETDLSQLPDDLLRGFDSQSFLDMPERIGYLHDLGLDYGWGPTAVCEWLLEHIHVYSGMPWWASIAAVAVLFRGAMFYPTLVGSKHSARMQKVQGTPEFKKVKAEFEEAAFRTHDRGAMMYARAEMRRLNKAADVSTIKPFVSFAMFPFTYGMFRLIRGMAGIPVPGMETGGMAWFTDLTVHDPLFVLPIISTGLAVLSIQQMQRANLSSNPAQETIMKGMTYIMPPLMFLGTAWLPAGLQWFFLCLSMSTVVQTQATLNPAVRAWADLPTLPDRNAAAPATQGGAIQYQGPTKRSFRNSLEDGMSAASKSLKDATGATDEKARWKKAKEYEDQRAEEERQKAMRRMDEVRRRRAERHS
ncbi:hypothetical protein F4680DRAFT_435839 [Xylaria scruposa]|nr:hypothetical protein F4680DRAFT_435839 [Xylaria scruposa]